MDSHPQIEEQTTNTKSIVTSASMLGPQNSGTLLQIYADFPELRPSQVEIDNQYFIDNLSLESEQDVVEAFEKFIEWFYLDESFYTRQLIDKLEAFVKEQSSESGLAEIKGMVKQRLESCEEVKELEADSLLREQALTLIQNVKQGVDDSWKKFTNYDSIKVWYKREEGLGLYTFYCEKMVRAPLFNLLSIIAEAQTYKDWVPLLYRSDIMHEVSHFRKSGAFAVKVPWPWWNRQVFISVSAMPVDGEKAIIITMKSLEGNTWLKGSTFERDENATDVTVHFCSCYIESVSENVQRLRFVCNVDPHFSGMPQWLLNQAIKGIAVVFLKQVARKAENLSDQYKQLIEEKADFYQQVEERINRVFKKLRVQNLLNGGKGNIYGSEASLQWIDPEESDADSQYKV